MQYNREQYLQSVDDDGKVNHPFRSYFYEMQALAKILIKLQKEEMIPPRESWPYHLKQFDNFEATTEFLDKVYRDLFPAFIRQCPDKASMVIAGYTLTPEGIVHTLHLRRRFDR